MARAEAMWAVGFNRRAVLLDDYTLRGGLVDQREMAGPITHVPGAFVHYSPRTGSALITKIYQHSRALEERGGVAYVMVDETREAAYDAGSVVRYSSSRAFGREWFTKSDRRIDATLAAVGLPRVMASRFYGPALRAVPEDAEAVVLYNQAVLAGLNSDFRGLRVLHLGNDIFARWRPREVVRALSKFDLTVAVSSFTAHSIMSRLPRSVPKIEVLRNGVDLEVFYPGPTPEGDPEILFVGNIVAHKGAHHLIKAALLLAQRGVRFTVRIVGSSGLLTSDELTSYEVSLRELAAPLGAAVKFRPFVSRDAIGDVYRGGSVFCMPTDWDEPAGQVVTEAMASGLPVVSAPRGGIPEYLGSDGVYVNPRDVDALADALQELIEDRTRAKSLGSALRRRAETMGWGSKVEEFDDLLRNARALGAVGR